MGKNTVLYRCTFRPFESGNLRILITGICGFVGSSLAKFFAAQSEVSSVCGIDNLIRKGSELNRPMLDRLGVEVQVGDIRNPDDLDKLPKSDWVIDAAALPSVLGGVDGTSSSRQVVEHNLVGTLHLLEHCKQHSAGFLLLSTSRVYSIEPLSQIPLVHITDTFEFDSRNPVNGMTHRGITEFFPTDPPISLYGSTKRASELMALEYAHAFEIPVWINRCGVMAGAGQFGRPDQGIFSFWLNSHLRRKPLKYLGFEGSGKQVRDCLHPNDLGTLLVKQIAEPQRTDCPKVINVGGGGKSAVSLRQLTTWCDQRFGTHAVESSDETRPYDLPWVVLDTQQANEHWGWQAEYSLNVILEEIAEHAEANPNWLDVTS